MIPTPNKCLDQALECALAIHRNIDDEKWSCLQDPLWVPTIHAHATVIRENLTILKQSHGELRERIQNYLGNGGLFNPELMEHDKVRNLLIDIRDSLPKPCDCEWTFVDDSFDHEFGTEVVHFMRCEKCGATKSCEPAGPDDDFREPISP